MKSSNEIRKEFLDFFQDRGHTIVPSAPVIPYRDPTLLFTNAGMNQFKDIFLGRKKPEDRRVADTQKCMRVSGKHNDLEEVGRDSYHHTFFEMLGNWSFGDYHKKEAIDFAWELLTRVWNLPTDRLHVSVFRDDSQAYKLWPEVTGIPKDRILKLDEKENFWEMGDTGPCGPCTEIHYDKGDQLACGPDCRIGCECGRFMEIWNLVFIQYDKDEEGSLSPLPEKHVDTGMGLERITSVLQDKTSNYDTDLFQNVIQYLEEKSGHEYKTNAEGTPFRVIADHIRALVFTIGDGAIISNEGRGYVLRRILRRAARFGRELGLKKPFLYEVADPVIDLMGDAFPEIRTNREQIRKSIQSDEKRFQETLESGIQMFSAESEKIEKTGDKVFPGKTAFRLYNTYGFPLDLTQLMAEEKGMTVDMKEFETCMEEDRELARRHGSAIGRIENLDDIESNWRIFSEAKSTFTGYDGVKNRAKILKWQRRDEDYLIVLDRNPFYAESGGQTGDKGLVYGQDIELEVVDTQRFGDDMVLFAELIKGSEIKDIEYTAEVDSPRRASIARNHTATHLLHAALRKHIGPHIQQSGSLVEEKRLRFDFSNDRALSLEKLQAVEKTVNQWILLNHEVQTELKDLEKAKQEGATALFSEKYDSTVRVISVGDLSMELCGGTHVHRTGDIGLVKITNEESVASGIRRIEAVTGSNAVALTQQRDTLLKSVCGMLNANETALLKAVEKVQSENKRLAKEIKNLKAGNLKDQLAGLEDKAEDLGGVPFICASAEGVNQEYLRNEVDRLKKKLKSVAVLLAGIDKDAGKVQLACGVTKDLIEKGIKAGDIIKKAAKCVGGGGGGRPDMAQAGGKDPSGIDKAFNAAREEIKQQG